jgi:hypothetical protein
MSHLESAHFCKIFDIHLISIVELRKSNRITHIFELIPFFRARWLYVARQVDRTRKKAPARTQPAGAKFNLVQFFGAVRWSFGYPSSRYRFAFMASP